jgi:hypothetical protein
MTGGDHGVTPDELERRLEANPRFHKAPPGDPDEVTIRFIPPGRTTDGDAVMLPTLRTTRAGEDARILQLTLHIARPAALHVGSADGWGDGGPHVIVRGTATRRVRVTDELLEWFAEASAQRGPFGAMVLTRDPDAPGTAAVHVQWQGFLDGLTEAQLAIACRAVGEGAKSCCVQLVNRFGAAVPTTY